MRILWVVSQILPEMADYLKLEKSNFGGWVQAMLQELKMVPDIELGVAGCATQVRSMIQFQKEGITYYILPMKGKNRGIKAEDCEKVVNEFQADLIHIEGTEWSISEEFSKIKDVANLISMQGILNAYEPYQYGDLPIADFMFSLSWKKLVTGWTLFFRKRFTFNKRLQIEKRTITNAQNIMGRTLWDRAHSYVFNQMAPYYTCNRNLREPFYKNEWDYKTCTPHTIFVGNGYSALKGVHFVIDAVEQLVNEYPDIHLFIAGEGPYLKNRKEVKKRIGYSYYLRKKLRNPKIKDKVTFIGTQNAVQMVEQLLKANVYVLPSLIENSPNTLGEAMLLGTPCVSAYTGGAGEMAIDEKEALLYRAGDAPMLAWQIKRIFDEKENVQLRCKNAKEHAKITHDKHRNLNALVNAYREILGKKED